MTPGGGCHIGCYWYMCCWIAHYIQHSLAGFQIQHQWDSSCLWWSWLAYWRSLCSNLLHRQGQCPTRQLWTGSQENHHQAIPLAELCQRSWHPHQSLWDHVGCLQEAFPFSQVLKPPLLTEQKSLLDLSQAARPTGTWTTSVARSSYWL